MTTYLLPENVRDGLLAYLVTRPMQEVEAGVAALRNLQPAADSNGRADLEELPSPMTGRRDREGE